MKRLFIITFILNLSLHTIAKDYSDCDSVRVEDFKMIYDLGNYTGKKIDINLNQPYHLNFLDDKHIIYTEWKESPLLRILDLDSLECIGYINVGFDQYDMLSVSDIQVRADSTVTVYDGSTGKFFELKWDPPLSLNLVDAHQLNKNAVFNVTKSGKNEFIWSGNNNTEFLCHKRDAAGKVTSFSTIPDVPKEEGLQVYDYDVQTKIYWNNKKQRLVTAAKPWDIISLYDGDMNLIKRMRGPIFIERKIRDNKGVAHVPWPGIHGYSGSIQNGDAGFSVAYGGMKEDKDDTVTFLQYIISFDWAGNPLYLIKSPKPALAYTYNIDTNNLLLVTEEDNKLVLTQFDLNSTE